MFWGTVRSSTNTGFKEILFYRKSKRFLSQSCCFCYHLTDWFSWASSQRQLICMYMWLYGRLYVWWMLFKMPNHCYFLCIKDYMCTYMCTHTYICTHTNIPTAQEMRGIKSEHVYQQVSRWRMGSCPWSQDIYPFCCV